MRCMETCIHSSFFLEPGTLMYLTPWSWLRSLTRSKALLKPPSVAVHFSWPGPECEMRIKGLFFTVKKQRFHIFYHIFTWISSFSSSSRILMPWFSVNSVIFRDIPWFSVYPLTNLESPPRGGSPRSATMFRTPSLVLHKCCTGARERTTSNKDNWMSNGWQLIIIDLSKTKPLKVTSAKSIQCVNWSQNMPETPTRCCLQSLRAFSVILSQNGGFKATNDWEQPMQNYSNMFKHLKQRSGLLDTRLSQSSLAPSWAFWIQSWTYFSCGSRNMSGWKKMNRVVLRGQRSTCKSPYSRLS